MAFVYSKPPKSTQEVIRAPKQKLHFCRDTSRLIKLPQGVLITSANCKRDYQSNMAEVGILLTATIVSSFSNSVFKVFRCFCSWSDGAILGDLYQINPLLKMANGNLPPNTQKKPTAQISAKTHVESFLAAY